jgi:hypothetical protein
MGLVLPKKSTAASIKDPTNLVLISNVKVGKTASVLQLPNSLIIDLEGGTEFFAGNKLNLLKEYRDNGSKGLGTLLLETADLIREANTANKKPIYDFIVIDTLTVVERVAKLKAVADYKRSLVGSKFQGKDVVAELAKGGGYMWWRNAFNDLLDPFTTLAGKCLILLAHVKPGEQLEELVTKEVNLDKGNKERIFNSSDSIGYIFRNKKNPNQNIISFKPQKDDIALGSRSEHLANKTFIFSEKDPQTLKLTTHWDLIFTSLQNSDTPTMEEIEDDVPVIEDKSEVYPS